MMVLAGYLLLALLALLQVLATSRLVRTTGDRSIIVGSCILFFWTFAGAWFFIGDSATGFEGYRIGLGYYYLMEKMFPFELDRNYLVSLILYGTFTAGVFLGLFLTTRRMQPPSRPWTLRLDPLPLSLAGVILLVASVLFVLPQLREALDSGASFYAVLRASHGPWYALHSVANELAAFSILMAQVMVLTRPRQVVSGPASALARWSVPALVVVLCLYLSLIGDRHSLLTMAIVAGLLLWSMTGRQVVRRGLPLFALLAVALLLGGQLRAFGTQELRTLEPQERIDEGPFVRPEIAHVPRRPEGPVRKAANVLLSNEMFAAHFSMYGILRNSVSPEPFISMRYLWASAAPAFVRGERPSSAYDLYARGAHLREGQGYTIHHAAGWYLNAGFAGPLLGGLLLGLVWGGVVRLRNRTDKYHQVLGVLPFLFVAFLPQVLRNGPEAYRTLLVEGLLLPVLILLLASAYRRRGRTQDIP